MILKRYLSKVFYFSLLASLFISGSVIYAMANIPVGCETPGDCDQLTPALKQVSVQDDLRLSDLDDSNYVGFQSADTVATDTVWTLPNADGTNGQVLSTNGSGILNWITGSGGGVGTTTTFSALTDTDFTGLLQGALTYFDGSNWVDLGVGTAGQALVVNAAGDAPEWVTNSVTEVTLAHGRMELDSDQTIATDIDDITLTVAADSAAVYPFNTTTISTGGMTVTPGTFVDNGAASQIINGTNTTSSMTVPRDGNYVLDMAVLSALDSTIESDDRPIMAVAVNGTVTKVYNVHDLSNTGSGDQDKNVSDTLLLTAGDIVQAGYIIEGEESESWGFRPGLQESSPIGGAPVVYSYFELRELPTTAGVGVGGSADGNGIVDADVTIGAGRNVGVTDNVTFDGGTFVIDGTNNRVGVGTGGPVIDLAIGDTDTGFEQISDGELAVFTNNVERVRFDGAGNVGIGIDNPLSLLHVDSQNTNSTVRISANPANGSPFLVLDETGVRTFSWIVDSGNLFVRDETAVADVFTIAGTTGNVGIGNFTATIDLAVGDSDTGLEQVADGQLGIVSNGSELVRFENGTTIVRQQNGAGEGGEIQFDGSNGQGAYIIDNFNDANNQDFRVIEGSVVRAFLENGVNGWQTPSDIRLKTDIETLSVLENIDAVRGAQYVLKDSGEYEVGVIAQEIKSVFPHAVSGDEDTGMLGVSYNAIASIALQGVKELKDLVTSLFDGLDSRVSELEKENADLKKRLERLEEKLN